MRSVYLLAIYLFDFDISYIQMDILIDSRASWTKVFVVGNFHLKVALDNG